jgi:hypothetical protein
MAQNRVPSFSLEVGYLAEVQDANRFSSFINCLIKRVYAGGDGWDTRVVVKRFDRGRNAEKENRQSEPERTPKGVPSTCPD